MAALVTVFIVVIVSLLVTRVATIALTLTGMSREAARFQARSALSGVGFTTHEAEAVVEHPVRRRIAMGLMIIGSAGIVTAIASVMLSFVGTSAREAQLRLLALAVGLLAILLITRIGVVDRFLSRVIDFGLRRWTDLESRDYAELLRLGGNYAVLELAVRTEDWVADRTLADIALRDEGIAVLGIEREGGGFLAAPVWSTAVHPGDTMIVYGPTERIHEVDKRPRGPEGDRAHEQAVAEHRKAVGREQATDSQRSREHAGA